MIDVHVLTKPKGVYFHIPFCTNKCFYCDFNSYILKGQPVTQYLQALERELALTVGLQAQHKVETIFVGGGTPTVLEPDQMQYFLQLVNQYFPIQDPALEFTMEANPGTTNEAKLAIMKAGGVNRISFGVQSFNNRLLAGIGRIHNTDDVYHSIKAARKVGFDNVSIDLMFGLPNQTLQDMEESLDAALSLKLEHYSIYGLKVEENTLFHAMFRKNELPLPEEDEELQMYMLIMKRLREAGYHQYEISNFALPGFEGKHNSNYWRNQSYYGLGAGAHGYDRRERHVNVKGVQAYIDAVKTGLPRLETAKVSDTEAMEDFMMVGLRLLDGVHKDDFHHQFSCEMDVVFGPQIDKLLRLHLLEPTEQGYRLSERGIVFGNEVFAEFIAILS